MRVIIIGGTGMLSLASREISETNDLLLLARNPSDLAKTIGARSMPLDWKDKKTVEDCIAKLELEPKIDILLSWIHEDGLWCLPLLENLLEIGGRSIRIHGSAVGDPSEGVATDPSPPRSDIKRQNVVLGWVENGNERRWLTDNEISQGALTAFRNADRISIVIGQITDSKVNEYQRSSLSFKL